MSYPVSAFIALRYTKAGEHNSFVSFINRFSVAGIALGLTALIIVLSVMNGFEAQLKSRILGIAPHIVVKDTRHQERLDSLLGVVATMEYIEAEGVVQSYQGIRGVQLQGVIPEVMQQHSIVDANLISGSFKDLLPGTYRVIIGRALAMQLDIRVRDTLRVMVAGASVYTPFGRMPSQRLVQVAGIYEVGSQMDDSVVLMHHDDLQRLLRQKSDEAGSIRLFLSDAFDYQQTLDVLEQKGVESDNWRARQGPLFDAVKMEKNMMFLMLLLIIAVAAFNIVSALVMVVTEKQGDIAILQTQGLGRGKIMQIFVFNGLFNGIKGSAIGLLAGVIITSQLNNILNLLKIPLSLAANGQGVPVVMQWQQVATVSVFALLLCICASLYPAMRAMRVHPATALQND